MRVPAIDHFLINVGIGHLMINLLHASGRLSEGIDSTMVCLYSSQHVQGNGTGWRAE